ncbi:hypothetical protein [Microbacterium kribbense]|uniref:hypothetical protein n=1 Tax=Microbacterium kribbense TaxID=433645 RepID=UPI0031D464A5
MRVPWGTEERTLATNGPWFRRRSVGFGWSPRTWQGWAIVGLFVAASVGFAISRSWPW